MKQAPRIVLHASSGMENKDVATAAGVGRDTVGTWRTRFARQRLAGLADQEGALRHDDP